MTDSIDRFVPPLLALPNSFYYLFHVVIVPTPPRHAPWKLKMLISSLNHVYRICYFIWKSIYRTKMEKIHWYVQSSELKKLKKNRRLVYRGNPFSHILIAHSQNPSIAQAHLAIPPYASTVERLEDVIAQFSVDLEQNSIENIHISLFEEENHKS